jgi:hypothetical protein
MMPQHMQFIQSVLFCVGFLTALLTNNFKQLEWTNPTLTKILNSTSLDKTFITAWKSVTKLVIFQSFVAKCCKMLYNIALQNLQFSVILYYKREMVPTSVRNTKWLHEHCKFRKAMLFAFYNISQWNFAVLLILWCSFMLWWNFV